MIKLIGFLFTFITVYAQETLFILPEHHSRFVHQLNRSFKNSSSILIVTPSFHHAELKKGILTAIKQGKKVKFIVQNPADDPISLVQYKNIDLYLSTILLNQSIILIDESLVCTTDQAINGEIFSSKHTFIRCSDNPHQIKALRNSLYPLLRSSRNYLE